MTTLAIVGARLNSSRLPGKHLLPLAGTPMIERIWQRLRFCEEIDLSVLATTADPFNQPLLDWAASHNVNASAYTGDVNDLMGRLHALVGQHQPDHIVYICGDCPLIDPGFIDHALHALKAHPDMDSIKLSEGTVSIHEGMAFYSRSGWDKLYQASTDAMSREHVGYADRMTPVLTTLPIPDSADFSTIQHRISVDTQADYLFMQEVYQRWYRQHDQSVPVDLLWVQAQLLAAPDLRAINCHVQQKRPDTHYAKVSLYSHAGTQIGMGHLKRCALIASALQEHLGLGTRIKTHGTAHDQQSGSDIRLFETQEKLLDDMQADNNPLLILDFHPDHIDMERLVRICRMAQDKGQRILALDKLGALVDWVDRLFIPGFYSRLNDPKVSYGWQNYLFAPIPATKKQRQVLILTGGSDALGYGATLPSLLQQSMAPDWRYIWVQGPLAAAPDVPDGSRLEVRHNPDDLPQLMASSDIVLSCYGLSLFEAMSARTATILLPVQHLCTADELTHLAAENACQMTNSLTEAVAALKHLQTCPGDRDALATRAAELFAHGSGITRLLPLVSELLASKSQ